MKTKIKSKVKNKKIVIVFIIILLILIIFLKNKITIEGKNSNHKEINKNNVETLETSKIPEKNNISSKIDLNHLQENESSFGKLDVPVYKKSEKDIYIPILIYHAFDTEIPNNSLAGLFTKPETFENAILTLKENGYTFITLEDLEKYNNGTIGLPEKNILITMDDGWLGCYTYAYPISKKYNVPATIFMINDLVENEAYFSWEQAKEMYESGLVKLGVHGKGHLDCSTLSKSTLISGYNYTYNKICEVTGDKVQKIMAYPSGSSNSNTISWLKNEGFNIQVQTKYGTVNKSSNLNLTDLGRVRAEQSSGKSILNKIEKGKK